MYTHNEPTLRFAPLSVFSAPKQATALSSQALLLHCVVRCWKQKSATYLPTLRFLCISKLKRTTVIYLQALLSWLLCCYYLWLWLSNFNIELRIRNISASSLAINFNVDTQFHTPSLWFELLIHNPTLSRIGNVLDPTSDSRTVTCNVLVRR